MEILVLHPGALGDIILSLPALGILRDNFKNARLTLAANLDFAATVAKGYADRVISLSALPLHRLYGSAADASADAAFWLAYERIVSWTGAESAAFTCNLTHIHPRALVTGWKPGPSEPRHVARLFIDSLREWFPVPADVPVPSIMRDDDHLAQGDEWLQERGWRGEHPLVAIHPGAGGAMKRWPIGRFRELASRLKAAASLVILEGPAEPGLAAELSVGLGSEVHPARDLPLGLLASVVSHCRAFVGNDSGIAHLAAGLGVPCVVLFGPTSPRNWAPLGPHVATITSGERCAGCAAVAGVPHTCLDSIPADMVYREIHRQLNSKTPT